jgi:hypothetical protein
VRGDARWWTTALLALSLCAGCYESHAAAPRGVDAGDDVPPSLCPFPDEAVVVIDDTPGCRFVTVDASDGPDICPEDPDMSIVDIRPRASIRVLHHGRRTYRIEHSVEAPASALGTGGVAYSVRMGDPTRRTGDDGTDCRCDGFSWGVAGAPTRRFWHGREREPGTETHVLLGTVSPDARVDVAVCVDIHAYEGEPFLAP